jgi:hypothetical protein
MESDPLLQPATSDDNSRPVATSDDEKAYSLTVKEVADIYESSGFPRTLRAIQRHCKNGDLASLKNLTLLGYEYRISKASVDRHISQLTQLHDAKDAATDREQSRPVATLKAPKFSADTVTPERPSNDDQRRTVAADTTDMSRYVVRLESENDFLKGQVSVKDGQIAVLQETVKQIIERDKETNTLMQGFQRLFSSMLGSPQGKKAAPPSPEGPGDQPRE